jgi:hypothetical protein
MNTLVRSAVHYLNRTHKVEGTWSIIHVRSLFSEGPLHIPYVFKQTAPHIPAPPCSPIPLRLCVRHEHTGMFRGPLLEPSAQSRGYLVDHTCQIIVQ